MIKYKTANKHRQVWKSITYYKVKTNKVKTDKTNSMEEYKQNASRNASMSITSRKSKIYRAHPYMYIKPVYFRH